MRRTEPAMSTNTEKARRLDNFNVRVLFDNLSELRRVSRFSSHRDAITEIEQYMIVIASDLARAKERERGLAKQVAALSAIDEQGIGHDDAVALIAHHVHRIQVLCDAFGYDPSEWLHDEVANDAALNAKGRE